MRNLVIDIGNTRVKYGVFVAQQLRHLQRAETISATDIFELMTNHNLTNIIYSSVASSLDSKLAQELGSRYTLVKLNAATPLPIKNEYGTPETLGKDRLAAVVGAKYLYPNTNCLVVDAGTCMTLDILTADGRYLGGNISPGVRMRWRAMHQQTARLPLVDGPGPDTLWGTDTTSALQHGGVLGAALEIEALASRLADEWPHLKVLLTGGDASLLANRIKYRIFVHPNLVLEGLNGILTYANQ